MNLVGSSYGAAAEELRLTTQAGRKIHVLLPEGGSYKIAHNGLMIIVK